ncbi:hypothetical protein FB451DRAFT_1162102 [Mycena latifolia]|nr:hypothetical protein FB451DRAFT_1162102 [Mycena latifolia]
MLAEQFLAKYDFGRFIWKPVDGSQCFTRPLAGAQIVQELYNRFEKGNQTICADGLEIRYQIPILATAIEVGDDDVAMLKYRVPSISQVEEWAARRLLVHHQSVLDLNQLREVLGEQKIPSAHGDQTWMHLVVLAQRHPDWIHFPHPSLCYRRRRLQNHQVAKQLEGAKKPAASDLPWGKEVENLTPAILNVLGPSEPLPIHPSSDEEPSFDNPLYATLGAEMQTIGESLKDPGYGLKPREGDKGWPRAQRVELVFSKNESEALLDYMKKQPYTLTVLAHATLSMVLVFDNPASEQAAQSFMNFCMVDVRPRLKAPYSSRSGYTGYALAPPMLRLPVSLFLSTEGTQLPLDKYLLLKVMDEIRERYTAHKMAVGYIAPVGDMFAYGMKAGYASNMYAHRGQKATGREKNSWIPIFKTRTGRLRSPSRSSLFPSTILILDRMCLSHLTETISFSYLFGVSSYFRLSSWNGVIDIGADFNANLISAEEVNVYLGKWKEFMFLVMS